MIATCEQCANELDAHGNCNYCMFQLGVSQGGESSEKQAPGMPALPSIEVLNRQFPQLEISRLVGRGGMGAIYQARQTTLDREVALKLIASEVAADPAFSERFEREAKTLAKLSHPHIVTVYDFGRTDDGQAYLVMEYVDGINLREAINTQSVGHEDALEIVSTICGALEYAHRKGVVHRDIKPENILLGEDGTLKVADFGIAKIIDDVRSPTLTATRQVLGSLHYLAPEHLEAPKEVDHRVDLYALGVVFYELLTGQLPLGRYEAPSSVKKSLDERIDRIVLKTLDRKPKNRYQSAAEIGSDLLEISQSAGVAAQDSPQAERPVRLVGAERANSVPFTSEAMGGLAEAAGILHVRDGCLSAEYRIRDALWGNFKSKTHVVDIPTARIASFDLISGFLGNKIVLVSDSIRALGELPNSETGRVEFKIKKGDLPLATQVVSGLGFGAAIGQSELEDRMADQEEEGSRWTLFAILMLLLGLLNGGGLAILEIMINTQIRDEVEQIALAIISAVMIGPIAVLQLLTGKLSLVARPYALAKAASVVSMLPLTPAFWIGIPTGIWARKWLANRRPQRAGSASSGVSHAATPKSQGWGATTMMYIRETRWGKMVATGNVILAVGALLLFLMISQGYFSRQLEYRIVDSTVAADKLKEAIETRIGDMGKVTMNSFFDQLKSDRFTIRATSAQHRKIEQALKISSAVSLVWLAPASGDAEGQAEISQESGVRGNLLDGGVNVPSAIELAPGTPISQGLKTVERPLGLAFLTLGQPLEISPAEVASVGRDTSVHVTDESYFGPKLEIELSTQGREKLMETIGGESVAGGIGLVVNGVIVGFAPTNEINGRQILVRYSDENDFSVDALIAAVRGPALPSELELLDD